MDTRTILVIDDSRLVRKMYYHRLAGEFYHVLTAASGEDGLDLLQSERVDLVLLDLGLPGIGGIEVLARITRDPALRRIPVIVFSAKEQETLMEQALELGAAEFISKATTPVDKVLDRIAAVLARDRADEERRHYRLGLDPVSLDAHDLATALGLDCLACARCGSALIVELTPDAIRNFQSAPHLEGRILCPNCESA